MADDEDTALTCVARHFRKIEIIVGLEVVEGTVPALVPAFDEDPGEAVLRSEVDVALGIFRRRTVARALLPGLEAQVHLPPDACVLSGPHPGYVAKRIRFVKIQDKARIDETVRIARDLNSSPGRMERFRCPHSHTVRPGTQRRTESAIAIRVQRIGRVVDKCRFVH